MADFDLAAARKRLGMTQAQLAEISGRHVNTISRYECGDIRPPRMLVALLTALVAAQTRQD